MRLSRIILITGIVFCLGLIWPGMGLARSDEGDQAATEDLAGDEEEGDLAADGEIDELDDEFALLQEEEVVFSAAKHEQDLSESPSSITVITREQIRDTGCLDLVCLLRQVPEIEVRRVYPLYASVGARALAGELGDKGLLLIDGREVNVEIFGMPFWQGLPVHPEDIERIEVVRGPGSALYGANAHSLLVSITTRRPSSDAAEVFLGGGEDGQRQVHLRADKVWGDWRLQLAGGMNDTGAYDKPGVRELRAGRARLHVEHEAAGWTEGVHLGFESGEGPMYTSVAPGYSRNMYITHAMAFARSDWLRAQVWASTFQNAVIPDMPLYFGPLKLGALPDEIDLFSASVDADVQASHSFWEGNLAIVGLNYRWLMFLSDTCDPDEVHQHRAGVFIHDEQRLWDQLILTAGARFDYNSITPFSFSPRLAAVWRFLPDHVVRVAFGQAFRKPSFFNTSLHLTGVKAEPCCSELTEFFRTNIGNDDLGNENVTTVEAGYRGRLLDGALNVELVAFFNWYRNHINFQVDVVTNSFGFPDLLASRMRFENMGRDVNTPGGSLSLVAHPAPWLWLSANYTFRYSYYIADPPSGVLGAQGDRIPWEPAHLFNLGASLRFNNGIRAGCSLHARSATSQDWTADGGLFGEPILVYNPPSAIVTAFAAYRFTLGGGWIETGLRIENLLNTPYRDTTGVVRFDGQYIGGEWMGRQAFVFLRAGL